MQLKMAKLEPATFAFSNLKNVTVYCESSAKVASSKPSTWQLHYLTTSCYFV